MCVWCAATSLSTIEHSMGSLPPESRISAFRMAPSAALLTSSTRSMRVVSSFATCGERVRLQKCRPKTKGGSTHHQVHAVLFQRRGRLRDEQPFLRLQLERDHESFGSPFSAELTCTSE
jgi:hypothetical protein